MTSDLTFAKREIRPSKGAPLHADDIAEIRLTRMPPELVLKNGEVHFISALDKPWLELFARANTIPLSHRIDVWSDLAEPFLDTEMSSKQRREGRTRLLKCGLSDDEVARIRGHIGPHMRRHTAETWEWFHYGHRDVLEVMERVLAPDAYKAFTQESMRIAGKGIATLPVPLSLRERMRLRWGDLMGTLAVPFATGQALAAQVMDAYEGPSRHYHNLEHIQTVLERAHALTVRRHDATAVALAAWFHDLVYDAQRRDNEQRSADAMQAMLTPQGVDTTILTRAEELVLRTADPKGAQDPSEQALMDADFSIIGESPEVYDRYTMNVRKEYAVYADDAYAQGRRAFLQGLLRYRDTHGKLFFALPPLCEALASENITRELAHLG